MPTDSQITQEQAKTYDEVRICFIKNPDSKSIELFLRSFGDGDGLGMYQLVEDVFYQCEKSDVVSGIQTVLEDLSIPDGVRYWTTQAAAAFPDDVLRNGLSLSLASSIEDIREAAELAVEMLGAKKP
ncbi:hypothetical protein RYA05_19950 [Pseudomonas syringae pv. actinidiae]|uniref:hypothetical protein n=1 Tax=Pseudomonas syringae TaxID=317 RepID=UPI000357392B|nr:hypothetical protein [Pseudomonas syringae]AOE59164.1 hypothetical protein NZ708_25630 [Pseudomonas syringae pv. actinidiae ICMP 18708]AYL83299.1 hypothetical protein CN228_28475 [Pseudomonas syringae pv. actinidiae str. Shaanxi_M228]EPM84453.1 hypothetical protein A3SM_10278 [Pseudomonas syringae pv. actinidiae ICMP 18886]EPN59612.1 hypothetical protein A235_26973 [Pseudomonas syringae pv. actinidiae ICMP 19079]EPN73895.1 hypothetical protein A233_20021 [Pseudomonas syringae pv. actinidiae